MGSDRRIAGLAGRQHGVIARGQLLSLGVTDSGIRRRVAAGRLHVVFRQVYVVGSADLTSAGLELAALLASGPGAALSHRTAAAVWGLRERTSRSIDVVTRTHRRAQLGLRTHEAKLGIGDVVVRGGRRVTSPERTLVDLADVVTTTALAGALARAERLGLVDRATFAERRGRRRVVLGEHVFTRSGLERRFLARIADWELPRPLVNQVVGAYEVDFLWPGAGLAVELGSYATHGDREAFERDRRKSADLEDRGLRVRRVTDTRLAREPEAVRRDLGRWLGRVPS